MSAPDKVHAFAKFCADPACRGRSPNYVKRQCGKPSGFLDPDCV